MSKQECSRLGYYADKLRKLIVWRQWEIARFILDKGLTEFSQHSSDRRAQEFLDVATATAELLEDEDLIRECYLLQGFLDGPPEAEDIPAAVKNVVIAHAERYLAKRRPDPDSRLGTLQRQVPRLMSV